MKHRSRSLLTRVFSPGRFLTLLAALSALAHRAPADPVAASGSMVDTVMKQIIDTRVDTVSGVTYVLGWNDSITNAVLHKYDAGGLRLTINDIGLIIRGITSRPAALAVQSGGTNLYVVGDNTVYRISADTGQVMEQGNATTNNSAAIKSVYCVGTNLYLCGNLTALPSSQILLFNKSFTTPACSDPCFLVHFPMGDHGTILSNSPAMEATLYGNEGGYNAANSVVVDETGDIYVGGKLGSGAFKSAFLDNAIRTSWGPVLVAGGSLSIVNIPDGATYHVAGKIYVPISGDAIFTANIDDTGALYVDSGTPLINRTACCGVLQGTNNLSAGLHDFYSWASNGGNGAGYNYISVKYGAWEGGLCSDTYKGYVMKFSRDLRTLKKCYFFTPSGNADTSSGDIRELCYSDGFVYSVGTWNGAARCVNPVDNSVSGLPDIEILKFDSDLKLKKRAAVKGVAENAGFSIAVDGGGNAYITGSYGSGSADFYSAGSTTAYSSIGSSIASIFLAKLDSSLAFQWVNKPITKPDFNLTVTPPKSRWNPVVQGVYWSGYKNSGLLTMGNAGAYKNIDGGAPESFLALLKADGQFAERVNLTIISEYGESGTQVLPYGGPVSATADNTRSVIKGTFRVISVPPAIYYDTNGVDITTAIELGVKTIAEDAVTRILCTGYSVGDNVANGTASSYSLTVNSDTTVTFHWRVEHALNIQSFVAEETRDPGNTNAPGYIAGLSSLAAGDPSPSVQKHWILENEPTSATIASGVDDTTWTSQGLSVRYAVAGYDADGAAAHGENDSTNKTLTYFPLSTDGNPLVRQQVPPFNMAGPVNIRWHWKTKLGVQVYTTGLANQGYPYIHVGTNDATVAQDKNGSGTFFFDRGTRVQIGSLDHSRSQTLQGWMNGAGTISPSTGTRTNLPGTFSNALSGYCLSFAPTNLTRPGRVLWDYGDRIFKETNFIGNPLTFNTVDDPAVRALLKTDEPPDSLSVGDVTLNAPGALAANVAMWDPVGKKYYGLIPSKLLTRWKTTDANSSDRILIEITVQYPAAPHYRHIANTRPVTLDPDPADLVSFQGMKYSTCGSVQDGKFTATNAGMSVLLFNQANSAGRGAVVTTPRIRVVQTTNVEQGGFAAVLSTVNTVIGRKITSSYDTAGLGTGYLYDLMQNHNASIYNRDLLQGPIIPVNNVDISGGQYPVVVWYENRDKILWPYQAVKYRPLWPTNADQGLSRIVIASRYGSESVDTNGLDQAVVPAQTLGTNIYPAETTLNPARFTQVKIYNQPDPAQPGYNPNEEHALLAPSLRSAALSPQPTAVYALRDGDLNTNNGALYTSDPYVLVQFLDLVDGEYKMKVYNIVRAATNSNLGDLSYKYSFEQEMVAGEPVIPFYPLPSVIGATPGPGDYGKDGQPTVQRCYWKDHKGTAWAVSGDSFFDAYYFYPLSPDFWWPTNRMRKNPGDFVAFLPDQAGYTNKFFDINKTTTAAFDYRKNDQTPTAQGIHYTTTWPDAVPILKVGETLTFPGGEYRSDHPTTYVMNEDGDLVAEPTPGLPGVVGFAAGQIVFDSLSPVMNLQTNFDRYTVRVFPALEERAVSLPVRDFPVALNPANGRTTVKNGVYYFKELSSSLQKRVYYDPIRAKLCIQGFLNDKDISDRTLTASPAAVYVLEPNVLTLAEKNILNGSAKGSPFEDLKSTAFATAMDALYNLTRNPNQLDKSGDGVDSDYRVGLEQKIDYDDNGIPKLATNNGILTINRIPSNAVPMQALGPGLALVANPAFLDPYDTNQISFVTLAENNSDALGGAPVSLHIIKVDKTQRYRGSIKSIFSDNVFDENIVLRHTGDFGGNAESLVFEWWYRPEDGTEALPPDREPSPSPWKLFGDPSGNAGVGFHQLTLKGNPSAPEVLLGDTLFYLRYRHTNEVVSGVNWEVPQPNNEKRVVLGRRKDGIPYDWAGAGNSSPQDINGDGQPDYIPQLAEGWVKRVMSRVNPYEARINDFSADNPATYSSIIQQLGAEYNGPVALNPDKNVIENVGLIALYTTLLERAKSLSIDLSTPLCTPSMANALQLASTRISDFYRLLGNEAYSDSLNPTIGYGSSSVEYGNMAPAVLAFQNQVATRLDEELGLLRGVAANNGSPVYNRLYWNFTHAEGEAAYAMKYNLSDITQDGFIDAKDAMVLYPQGHGDAWGHYLTSETLQYDLLRHPYFNWVSRSEFINSQDVVIPVDYLDERKFAQTAAAKAQAGVQIVSMTYRQKYVADPRGQWQGYLDTDPQQAWGADEWARRAGQGAYFDWVTANALLPAEHPNTNYTGIQKVDRTTVTDIAGISGALYQIQQSMDQVDKGNNPLGIPSGALTFEIDPNYVVPGYGGDTYKFFDQTYAKAVDALNNAKATFDNANVFDNLIRQVANNETEFRNQVYEEDLGYRNELIEIFGTPYEGTIGSGKLYPAGYQGPDTALYAYVKVNTVNDDTVPQPSVKFGGDYKNQIQGEAFNYNGAIAITVDKVALTNWQSEFGFNTSSSSTPSTGVNYADFSRGLNGMVYSDSNSVLQNLNLPIMPAGYSYVAPSEWGSRASVGQLQTLINQMVQAQADLNREMFAWDTEQQVLINKLRKLNQDHKFNDQIRGIQLAKGIADNVADLLKIVTAQGGNVAEYTAAAAGIAALTVVNSLPTDYPTAGVAINPGNLPTTIAQASGDAVYAQTELLAGGIKTGSETAGKIIDTLKGLADLSFDQGVAAVEDRKALFEELLELQTNLTNEADKRVGVFKQIQVLLELSDNYRTTLANGVRKIQQRSAFNKRTAAQTQQNRYQDISFRFARNAALEKYRSAFDLASRYAYLAAAAYDYDLNLSLDDAGSPVSIMSDIVKQRSVGLVLENSSGFSPQVGAGGLAEDLARLRANYNTLSARMGLMTPQSEMNTFSLRSEAFRLYGNNATNADTAAWQRLLKDPQYQKSDLWQVPEFRRYCRSFAPESAGPQPGLVIPFHTDITSGKNFFGWPLGGGESAYDPSVYATRVLSLAVAFSGYDTVNLSRTPRVYLIPAGTDIMTVPNSPSHETREWSVRDYLVPVPFPASTASLGNPNWKPGIDSITDSSGTLGNIRQFSSFKAMGFASADPADVDASALTYDSRLIGRSVWNRNWLLIIPGATFHANAQTGLNTFINSVSDISLIINSYSYSGN